jgi:5-methylcytosine-specific restriction endonuclease McrA
MERVFAQPKRKALRLKGKKLIELYRRVYEKSNGRCVECGTWIPPGTIPHHIIFKSQGGEDTEENLEMRCPVCHGKAHGINVKEELC